MQITVLFRSHFSNLSYYILILALGCCNYFYTANSTYISINQNTFLHASYIHLAVFNVLHVSEAGCPAADAASDSGPDHLPPAPMQSAQCSAVRGGPAGRRSHPGRREMETD